MPCPFPCLCPCAAKVNPDSRKEGLYLKGSLQDGKGNISAGRMLRQAAARAARLPELQKKEAFCFRREE